VNTYPTIKTLPAKWRRELKLLLPRRHNQRINDFLMALMSVDSHALDGRYMVKSLYYDSDVLGAFFNKKAGDLSRFKVRLRTYPGTVSGDQAFLEIKRRRGDVVWKERFAGPAAMLHRVATNSQEDSKARSFESTPTLSLLRSMMTLYPKVSVEYERVPFQGSSGGPLRITIDGPVYVEAFKTIDQLFAPSVAATDILNGYSILEVKFQHSLPVWFDDLIKLVEMPVITYSKYVEATNYLLQTNPAALGFSEIKRINDGALVNYLHKHGAET